MGGLNFRTLIVSYFLLHKPSFLCFPFISSLVFPHYLRMALMTIMLAVVIVAVVAMLVFVRDPNLGRPRSPARFKEPKKEVAQAPELPPRPAAPTTTTTTSTTVVAAAVIIQEPEQAPRSQEEDTNTSALPSEPTKPEAAGEPEKPVIETAVEKEKEKEKEETEEEEEEMETEEEEEMGEKGQEDAIEVIRNEGMFRPLEFSPLSSSFFFSSGGD